MVGLTSPVNAPSSCQWQFWAPSWIGRRSASVRVWRVRKSVNGGQTTTSQCS